MMENQGSLFISYGRKDDEEFVTKLCEDLKVQGYNIWHDKSGSLHSDGLSFNFNIREGINSCSRLLLVVGPHSSKSPYVRTEWEYALSACKVIIPLLRQGNEPEISAEIDYELIPEPLKKRRLHCIDFRQTRVYEDSLNELLRNLSIEVLEPVSLKNYVPNLPDNYFGRVEEIDRVKEVIMQDSYSSSVVLGSKKNTVLHGMGGIGKSVIAAAVCRDCDVRRLFRDGIYWITIGQQNTVLQRRLREITGDNLLDLENDFEGTRYRILDFLHDKNCLIVLDDVWNDEQVNIFASDDALRCRILVTTRNKHAVEFFSWDYIEVGLLSERQSLQLLLNVIKKEKPEISFDNLPGEAHQIIEQCGFLPLALNMTGAMISEGDKDSWKEVLINLQKADLVSIDKKPLNYKYANLFKVLDASVTVLEEYLREKYLLLGIFQKNALIPKEIIQILWSGDDANVGNTSKILNSLVARSLLGRNEEDLYSLHDLQVDYLQVVNKHIKITQQVFIDRIGDPLQHENAFIWENYIWHLKEAGEEKKAIVLLSDFRWLKMKLKATDIFSVLKDYQLITQEDFVKDQIFQSLKLSTHVLVQDKRLLASQMLLRLENDVKLNAFFTECVDNNGMPLLKPVNIAATQTIKTDRIFRTFDERILKVSANSQCIFASTLNGNVYKWNKDTGALIETYKAHQAPVNDFIVTDNHMITVSDDKLLKIWYFENGEVEICEGFLDSIWRIAIHQNKIIAASNDGMLQTLSISTGERELKIGPLINKIPQLELYADGTVCCYSINILYVVNLHSGLILQHLEHFSTITCFVRFENGVASVCKDGYVRIWDLHSGYLLKSCAINRRDIFMMLVSEGFLYLGSLAESFLIVIDLEIMEIIEYPLNTTEGIYSMVIYKDYIIAGLFSGDIRVFDKADPSQAFDLEKMPDGAASMCVNETILYAGTYGGMVYSWILDKITPYLLSSGKSESIDIGPLSCLRKYKERIYCSSEHGFLQCWSIATAELLYTLKFSSFSALSNVRFKGFEFAFIDDFFGVPQWDGNISFCKIDSGEYIFSTNDFVSSLGEIENDFEFTDQISYPLLCYQITGEIVVGYSLTGYLRFWNMLLRQEVGRTFIGPCGYPLITKIDKFVILSLWDNKVAAISYKTFVAEQTWEEHTDFISVIISYTEKVITGSGDGTIKIWSLYDSHSLHTLEAHDSAISSLKVYNNVLVSCSMDYTIKFWNLLNYQLLHSITGAQDFQSLEIINNRLFMCSRSGLISIYELDNQFNEIVNFIVDDLPYFLQVSEKYNRIICGGRSGKLHFIDAVGLHL